MQRNNCNCSSNPNDMRQQPRSLPLMVRPSALQPYASANNLRSKVVNTSRPPHMAMPNAVVRPKPNAVVRPQPNAVVRPQPNAVADTQPNVRVRIARKRYVYPAIDGFSIRGR